jgi:hypothetical protein
MVSCTSKLHWRRGLKGGVVVRVVEQGHEAVLVAESGMMTCFDPAVLVQRICYTRCRTACPERFRVKREEDWRRT